MKYKPVFIIGAARSGTNILRNMINLSDDVVTWPCDEINYIWKHGNLMNKSKDRFTKKELNIKKKLYIQNQFHKLHKDTNSNFVLEKTVANSLRVDYIDGIFPKAKYISIFRDGRDVVESSIKRWQGKVSGSYLLKKLKYLPLVDSPYHITFQAFNKIYKSISGNYYRWGPQHPEIDNDFKKNDLKFLATKQWVSQVKFAISDFQTIENKNILKLNYNNFVNNPIETMNMVYDFIGIKLNNDIKDKITKEVHRNSVNKKYIDLNEELELLIKKTNNLHNKFCNNI